MLPPGEGGKPGTPLPPLAVAVTVGAAAARPAPFGRMPIPFGRIPMPPPAKARLGGGAGAAAAATAGAAALARAPCSPHPALLLPSGAEPGIDDSRASGTGAGMAAACPTAAGPSDSGTGTADVGRTAARTCAAISGDDAGAPRDADPAAAAAPPVATPIRPAAAWATSVRGDAK